MRSFWQAWHSAWIYDVVPTVRLCPSMPLPPLLGRRNLPHVIVRNHTRPAEPTFAPDDFSEKDDSSVGTEDEEELREVERTEDTSSVESTSSLGPGE